MSAYVLRYARVVILETKLEAADADAALAQAGDLEHNGQLGLRFTAGGKLVARANTEIVDIADYDAIWTVFPDPEGEEPGAGGERDAPP